MTNPLRFLRKPRHPRDDELSAHVDGQLAPARAAALEAHIAGGCDACAERFEGLLTLHTALRSMPEVDAPRSFRLRAADVAAPQRSASRGPSMPLRLAPFAGAAAAIALVVIVAADYTTRSSGSGDKTSGFALQASGDSAARSESAPAETPPVAGAIAPPDTADAPAAGTAAAAEGAGATAAGDGGSAGADADAAAESTAAAASTRDAAPEAVAPQASPKAEQSEPLKTSVDDDDDRNLAFAVAEFTAAAIAATAALVYAASRWRRSRS